MKEVTSKNLEQRINSALSAVDISSNELSMLIAEVETAVSDETARIQRERAFDISTGDAASATSALTEAEVVRGRYKLALPDLRQKLTTTIAREEEARFEEAFQRGVKICNEGAEEWAELPELEDRIKTIFTNNEARKKELSQINSTAPVGEGRRLPDPELLWRCRAYGLESFSRANPPMAERMRLPAPEHSELGLVPRAKNLTLRTLRRFDNHACRYSLQRSVARTCGRRETSAQRRN
jgi:hypothetical protein